MENNCLYVFKRERERDWEIKLSKKEERGRFLSYIPGLKLIGSGL